MKLHKCLLTKNDCYKSGKKHKVTGIMWHSTGANNPNLKRYVGPDDGILGRNRYNNHWNQAKPGGTQKCVHAFIGKDKDGVVRVYQTLPWDMQGWHSGVGPKGSAANANRNGYIGFEICEDALDDKDYFNEVYRVAVEFTAFLCKEFKLDVTDTTVIDHSEGYKLGIASNHRDISHWLKKFGKSMDTVRADVKKRLTEEDVTENKVWYRVRKSWKDAASQIGAFRELSNALALAKKKKNYKVFDEKGNVVSSSAAPAPSKPKLSEPKPKANLIVNGFWDEKVTRALQIYFGTTVDGYLSNQPKNSITAKISGINYSNKGGSMVIKALQRFLGFTGNDVDGRVGPMTIRGMQKKFGTIVDGNLSSPSMVIKELQRRLNRGKL